MSTDAGESSARRHAGVTPKLQNAAVPVRDTSPDRFQLICEVGQGGMATVYLALLRGDAGFSKLVALKQPKASLASDDEFLEMFLDEARLAARLNHPHVVQTYEVGRHGGKPFIAMEFLEGQPLHRVQRAVPGGIPLPIHLRIIADALAGLHHAHELRDFSGAALGVVHRDVSPQNFLVSYDGQTKVVDFGIAKAVTHGAHTELGLVKGKLPYVSPEQILGEPIDRRADIFSVGVMLWEAGARERLWPSESARSRLRLLSLADIPKLRELDERSPPELDRICRRALSYAKARRYETAAALEADVERVLSELGEPASRRDVAEFMHQHFEADRLRTRKLIEEQLGHLSLDRPRKGETAAAQGVATEEGVQGTRRLAVPVTEARPMLVDHAAETPTTVAPATATVGVHVPASGRGRRMAVGALVAAALAVLALRFVGISGKPAEAAARSRDPEPAATPSSDAVAAPAPSQTALANTAVPVSSASPVHVAVARATPLKGTTVDAVAAPAVDPVPPEPALDSEVDLTRLHKREKKPARALDTADPWSH